MARIKGNLIGLFRFLPTLLSLLIPFRLRRRPINKPSFVNPKSDSEYDALIGPSEPLIPTEPVFCPKCHVLVAHLRHTKQGTEIIQNNKGLITIGSNVIVGAGGKTTKGFPIRCPNGHTVEVY